MSTLNAVILWYILIAYPLSLVAMAAQVNKPRKPLTPGMFIVAMLTGGALIVMAALALFGGK